MPVKKITGAAHIPYVVKDVSNLYDGRTIVMKQLVPTDGSGAIGLSQLAPPDPGVPCGIDSINVSVEDGVAAIEWTFRTQFDDPSGGGGGGAGGGTSPVYELEGSTSQEPITSHPNYADLFNKYNGKEQDGSVVWAMKDPDGGAGATGLASGGGEALSPMYGVTDYMAANAVYKVTEYYRTIGAIPGDLVSMCGKINDAEGLDASGVAGRWLRSGASVRQMGDSFQVTKMWMASQSEKNLWKSEIYG
jgi:hypothetical protein